MALLQLNNYHCTSFLTNQSISFWGTRTLLNVLKKNDYNKKGNKLLVAKCGAAEHRQMKQCTALLQCFVLPVCEALLLQQKPGILNPQGSQWEGKASWTIPVLGACGEIQRSVNPEPLSLLRAWDWGQCFTMALVPWGEREEEQERRSEMKRQRCSDIERDSQGLLGEKNNKTP